ncbi:MAG: hypothetical protein AAF830_09060 [Pseudomonadota bacterium]
MSIALASTIWQVVGIYLAIGLVFGIIFIFLLVGRLDDDAKGMRWWARLTILPGVALLWPLMLIKVLFGKGRPVS